MSEAVKKFSTGATRTSDEGKIDPEAFLDPLVVEQFCNYMNRHRVQSDGGLREGDNWQNGFTRARIMKSLWRHMLDLWLLHRNQLPASPDHLKLYEESFARTKSDRIATREAMLEALSALYFNVGAYLREVVLDRDVIE